MTEKPIQKVPELNSEQKAIYSKISSYPDRACIQAVSKGVNPISLLLETRAQVNLNPELQSQTMDNDFKILFQHPNSNIEFYEAIMRIFARARFTREQSVIVIKAFLAENNLSTEQMQEVVSLFQKALDSVYPKPGQKLN